MLTKLNAHQSSLHIVRLVLLFSSCLALLFTVYWTWHTVETHAKLKSRDRALTEFSESNLEYFSLIKDVETGVRGYLLTQDPEFLDVVMTANMEMARLSKAIRDRGVRVGAEMDVVERVISTIEKRKDFGNKVASAESIDSLTLRQSLDEGKEIMDEARARVAQILEWARRAERQVQSDLDRTLDNLSAFIMVTGMVGVLLTLLATYVFQSEIRARIKVQQDLAASQEKLTLALEGARLGSWHWDLPKDSFEFSPRAKAILGLPSDYEMTYSRFLSRVHPDDRQRTDQNIHAARSSQESFDIEFRCVWPDGQIYWVTTRGMAYFDNSGHPARMEGIVVNINDRKVIEQQLRLADTSKSEFLSRMSHELRTPLNAILGYGQLMDTAKLDDDDKDNLRHILRAGQHLLSLINEVLDISRIEAGRLSISPETLSVTRVIEESMEMVRPVAAARSITVKVERSADKPLYVRADHQRVRQVLLNLINNAVKFNRNGGWVVIRCSSAGNSAVRLMIQDNGPGIAQEHLDRLFTPFERLGADQAGVEGTGLGLVVSKRLIELMGGEIGVDSSPGRGSTFWIELPAAEPPPDGAEVEDEIEVHRIIPPYLTVRKVLYIEDNPENLRLVQKIVGGESGVKLLVAVNGEDGITVAESERPHLILLDLHLPGIGGAEVLHRLRAIPDLVSVPVIILSADATPGQIRRLMEIGADEYLTKPFDVETLRRTITRLMIGGRTRA